MSFQEEVEEYKVALRKEILLCIEKNLVPILEQQSQNNRSARSILLSKTIKLFAYKILLIIENKKADIFNVKPIDVLQEVKDDLLKEFNNAN